MINEIQKLLDQYVVWLKDKTALREVSDCVEITTPYLDRHNDYLQIYAKRENGGFILTDDGYILEGLEQSGCHLETHKRRDLLKMTLNGFGVRQHDKELRVHTTTENFAIRKHNLIQAMLAVNDLFYVANPVVANLFFEDVTAWLDLYQVRYTPRVQFVGKTGFNHAFDFVIPKSPKSPERMLRAISRPSRDTAEAFVFAWTDTKEVRAPNAKAYALLNDGDLAPSASVIDAFRNYDILPILWSNREKVKDDLAA